MYTYFQKNHEKAKFDMIWWITAALCAFFVKGLCGFANALVFTSILTFTSNNVDISPVNLLLSIPTNIIVAVKKRKRIKWSVCLPLSALVIVGSIPGALFLKNADTGVIKIIFGIVTILLGLEMLLREYKPGTMKQSKALLGVIGLLSGILCGLYGIGALLSAYISQVTDDSSSFKANICTVFLADNLFRCILYSIWGIFTADILKLTLILVPFMFGGLFLGMVLSSHINEKLIRQIVIVLLILSGVMLIPGNV